MNGNIFVELFLSDLDEKITSASYKRKEIKTKRLRAEPISYSSCQPRILHHEKLKKSLPLDNFSLRSQ